MGNRKERKFCHATDVPRNEIPHEFMLGYWCFNMLDISEATSQVLQHKYGKCGEDHDIKQCNGPVKYCNFERN